MPATKITTLSQRLGGVSILDLCGLCPRVNTVSAETWRPVAFEAAPVRRLSATWDGVRSTIVLLRQSRIRPAINARGLHNSGRFSEAKMTPWMIAFAFYFAVGLVLIFVGPTARLLRREREKLEWQAYDQPRWKLTAFSGVIALGIMLLWPILVVSAARKESAYKVDLLVPRSFEPSAELDRWVSEVQDQYPKSLPYEAYREIVSKIPWTDHEHFDRRLAQLNCTITGYAKGPEGKDFAVMVPVLGVGVPFTLTRLRGRVDALPTPPRLAEEEISLDPLHHGLSFRLPSRPDDEVWEFSSSQDSWQHLAGRAGLALIRERTVIDAYVTMMS